MEFAKSKTDTFIHLNRDNYYTLSDEMISFLDQYIFRFAKLHKAFIDILNRLEKLRILDSALEWIQIRKIRYDIAHEYPASLIERIEGINYLFDHIEKIRMIIERCRSIILNHN